MDENEEWLEGLILWTGTLITLGAAVGALTLAPILTRKLVRGPTIGIGGFICFALEDLFASLGAYLPPISPLTESGSSMQVESSQAFVLE